MYYLFETHKNEHDCQPDKHEWWWQVYSHKDKEQVLAWHKRYPRQYARKLVYANYAIKDCFYPHAEIKTTSSTAQLLKRIGFK